MASVFQTVSRIVYGFGAANDLPREIARLGGSKAMIITDKGITKNNIHNKILEAVSAAGIPVQIWDDVILDPTVASIEACVDAIQKFGATILVGIGGGSAMDTTKVAALRACHPGPVSRYYGMHKVPGPCLPTILVPTTAGTGSEMTSIGVIADPDTNAKIGLVSDYLYAKSIVLDPELTLTLPPTYTAYTGLDAFVHAMESYVNLSATPFTEGPDLQAMKMIADNLRKAYTNGNNHAARESMLYASSICGMGFSNTQNGVIHAIGMAVPATYHLPHGLLMAACGPMGIAFNYKAAPEKYAKIATILGCDTHGKNIIDAAEMAAAGFTKLMLDVDITPGLSQYGVKKEDIHGIAERAASSARLMCNNPRQATAEQLEALITKYF